MTPDIHKLLSDYAAWTATIWSGDPVLGTRDFAVMSLGVAGECGEAAEALLALPTSRAAVTKELGDVLYYWGRLCDALSFPVESAWPADGVRASTATPLELCLAGAKVAEAMKKLIRGDSDGDAVALEAVKAKVQSALKGLATVWVALCEEHGLAIADVVSANRSKLTDRQARNVLRGNGDER